MIVLKLFRLVAVLIMSSSSSLFTRALGQSLNVDALKALGKVAQNPGLSVPHISVLHVGLVDWHALRSAGIRGVVFDKGRVEIPLDIKFRFILAMQCLMRYHMPHLPCSYLLDNTLTAPYVDTLDARAVAAIESCRSAFGRDNLVLMSNSVGGPDDTDYADAIRVEMSLDIPVLRRRSKKPKGFEELLEWFNRDEGIAESEPVQPHELCMVGDRVLTDVLFGNLHGNLNHTLWSTACCMLGIGAHG